MQKKFTDRLKELRGTMSQTEFANKIGLIQQTYARWENGQHEPNIEKIKKLAHDFRVTTDWLLGESDAEPPPKTHDPPALEIDREDVKTLIATNAKLVAKLVELCGDVGHRKKDSPASATTGGGHVIKTA